MHGTSNATNTRFYYNNSENQRAEKDSDVVMQRKTNINGQKIVVFERVANGTFREKINNFFTGLRRASPNKMQQFFESRSKKMVHFGAKIGHWQKHGRWI